MQEFSEEYYENRKKELEDYAKSLDAKEVARMKRHEARKHQEEEEEKFHQKMLDLGKAYPFNEQQIEIIYNKAWEDGHAHGYHEVEVHMESLLELFTDFLNAGK